jgi:hypothetical protein
MGKSCLSRSDFGGVFDRLLFADRGGAMLSICMAAPFAWAGLVSWEAHMKKPEATERASGGRSYKPTPAGDDQIHH